MMLASGNRSVFDPEIVQIRLEAILRGQAGVHEIVLFAVPLLQPAIVKELQIILDDERNDVMLQTLLEQDQPTDASVPVLKRMDALKGDVERDQVFKNKKFFSLLFYIGLWYYLRHG